MIRAWWKEKTQREQRTCLAIAAVLTVLMGWILIIKPLNTSIEKRVKQVQTLKNDLAWMREQATLRGIVRHPTLAAPLIQIAQDEALKARLSIQFDTIDVNQVKVRTDTIPADSLSRWLSTLHYKYGIVVEELEFTAKHTNGMLHLTKLRLKATENAQ